MKEVTKLDIFYSCTEGQCVIHKTDLVWDGDMGSYICLDCYNAASEGKDPVVSVLGKK